MDKKRVIVSVTNDLVTDQRVHKTCIQLYETGFEVLLVGRKLKNSLQLDRPYTCKRMSLWFTKGALFYAEYNLRLFFFLLVNKTDVYHANDLDTLLANYLASKIKGKVLVYDTHEYYTGVPELQNRPAVRKIWEAIEGFIFPKLKYAFTVNKSIADLYRNKYGIPVHVMRNISSLKQLPKLTKNRTDLGLPADKKIIILQGSGINIQRGSEELLLSMKYVNNALLLIVGSGDVITLLEDMCKKENLTEKVKFVSKVPYAELMQYTYNSTIGVTLDKPVNLNYQLSLPNKLFDYIHGGIPVLASNIKEVASLVNQYSIGVITESHQPEIIANHINEMLQNEEKYLTWKRNLARAQQELSWENEVAELTKLYEQINR